MQCFCVSANATELQSSQTSAFENPGKSFPVRLTTQPARRPINQSNKSNDSLFHPVVSWHTHTHVESWFVLTRAAFHRILREGGREVPFVCSKFGKRSSRKTYDAAGACNFAFYIITFIILLGASGGREEGSTRISMQTSSYRSTPYVGVCVCVR